MINFKSIIVISIFVLIGTHIPCVKGIQIDQFAAIVNDFVIMESQIGLESSLMNLPLSLQATSSPTINRIDILNLIIDRYLIISKAKDFIEIKQKKIDEKLEEITMNMGGKQQLDIILAEIMMSHEEFRQRIRNILLFHAYIEQRIRTFVQIQPKEIELYIAEHSSELHLNEKDQFQSNDLSQIKQLIFKYLTEVEVNKRLKKQLKTLRDQSQINILLQD